MVEVIVVEGIRVKPEVWGYGDKVVRLVGLRVGYFGGRYTTKYLQVIKGKFGYEESAVAGEVWYIGGFWGRYKGWDVKESFTRVKGAEVLVDGRWIEVGELIKREGEYEIRDYSGYMEYLMGGDSGAMDLCVWDEGTKRWVLTPFEHMWYSSPKIIRGTVYVRGERGIRLLSMYVHMLYKGYDQKEALTGVIEDSIRVRALVRYGCMYAFRDSKTSGNIKLVVEDKGVVIGVGEEYKVGEILGVDTSGWDLKGIGVRCGTEFLRHSNETGVVEWKKR